MSMEHEQLNNLREQLLLFEHTTLEQMDRVSLMDRIDTKFVFEKEMLTSILSEISSHYYCLEINKSRVAGYKTDYFDTLEHKMYHAHHNQKQGRYKIRFREYVGSELSFLEIKYKNNKGKTFKNRIQAWHDASFSSKKATDFIQVQSPFDKQELTHALTNKFNRITLVNKKDEERVTIDFSLQFSRKNQALNLNDLVIIEVKQARLNRKSKIMETLKNNSLRKFSFSKYAIGMVITDPTLKYNHFKKTLLFLNKINKDGNIWNSVN